MTKGALRQPIAAIDDCNKAIQLKPDFAEAYFNRGLAQVMLMQPIAAIDDCNRAIQLKPDYAEAHFTRGFAKYRVGRIWEAKQDLRIALRLAEQSGNESLKIQVNTLLQKLN